MRSKVKVESRVGDKSEDGAGDRPGVPAAEEGLQHLQLRNQGDGLQRNFGYAYLHYFGGSVFLVFLVMSVSRIFENVYFQ